MPHPASSLSQVPVALRIAHQRAVAGDVAGFLNQVGWWIVDQSSIVSTTPMAVWSGDSPVGAWTLGGGDMWLESIWTMQLWTRLDIRVDTAG